MKIAVVILAGGEGRRIGGDKPLRLLAGRTLLSRALDQARKWSDSIAIAARSSAQLGGADVRWLADDSAIEGPLGGLSAGLRFAQDQGSDALLTIPADMPFLPADLAPKLARALSGSTAALASSEGRLHPVCGLWSPAAMLQLDSFVGTGRRSLTGFAQMCGHVTVDWATSPIDPFFNINRPEDLELAERVLSRG